MSDSAQPIYLIDDAYPYAFGTGEPINVFLALDKAKEYVEKKTQQEAEACIGSRFSKDNLPLLYEWYHAPDSFYYYYYFWMEIREGKYLHIWDRGKLCWYPIREMAVGVYREWSDKPCEAAHDE